MADQKISQLSDGGASQATDEYVIARSGSNYRIDGASVAAAATSVGTLSSLTVSGDLTVDTSTLYVKSSTNQVGVGTTGFTTGAIFQVKTATDRNLSVRDVSSELSLEAVNDGSSANIPLRYYASTHKWFAGTNPMTLDASGNLGLGVTPSAWASGWKALDIGGAGTLAFTGAGSNDLTLAANSYYDTTDARWEYKNTGDKAARYSITSAGTHAWYNTNTAGTAGNAITFTQAMTLDASGNLLNGCTSIRGTGWSTNPGGHYAAELTNYGGAQWFVNRNDAEGAYIVLGKSRGSTANATTIVQNGDTLGRIIFSAADGDAVAQTAAYFECVVDGTPGASADMPGRLAFWTVPDGSGTPVERARITSGGYFKASNDGTYFSSSGTTHEFRNSVDDNHTLIVHNTAATLTGSGARGIFINYTAAPNATDRAFVACFDGNGATQRASIRSNGGLANYQSNNVDLSDARTKTDITPAASMWDKVAALEIVTYKYNDQTHDDVNLGVIAQQVETVEPIWVDPDGFGETPEGEEPLKTVYTKDITFAAIKALQEAMARIEALEARLEALEA